MKQVIIFSLLFLSLSSHAASTTRSGLGRYILLRDRSIVDELLAGDTHQSFFQIHTNVSSGLKDLIGDIKSSTGDQNSSSQKTSNVLAILNKNINTEKYIDIGLDIGIPLPSFSYSKFKFVPSLFATANVGGLVTVSNKSDGLNPEAQIYLNKEIKVGLASDLLWQNRFNEKLQIALYQKSVSDLSASRNASTIAAGGAIVETSELTDEDKSYSMDIYYKRDGDNYALRIELLDLKLMEASGSKESTIGNSPFIHTRYDFKNKSDGSFLFTPFIGAHYRKRYTLAESLYLGTLVKYNGNIPVSAFLKIDNQFITLRPQIKFRYLTFSYGLRMPYQNPQDDIWVPTIHSINIGIPF